MPRKLGDRPVNRQAANGISYGPGEERYRGELEVRTGPDDFVLTRERHEALKRELAAERAKRAARNAARKERRAARKLAEEQDKSS